MAPDLRPVSIGKIYLDPENPRHETLPDESSIIRHLIAKEQVRALAKDIAEAGSINPLELIALVRHPKVKTGFIVVEGNRRICSLKLLADPDKAGTEKDRRYFKNLAQNMPTRIPKIQAAVFGSREAARRWFALRHEGEQGGIGTKAWDATQKTRFSLRNSGKNPNIQAQLIIDYVKQYRLLNHELWEQLSVTTVTRYLSNPVFRHALGLHDGNSLQINVPDAEFERALVRFLKDSLDPEMTGVSSRTSADDRKGYAIRLHQDGVAATSFGVETHVPRTGEPNVLTPAFSQPAVQSVPGSTATLSQQALPPTAGGPLNGRPMDNRNPDKRTNVISSSFKVHVRDKTLKRLYDELKGIDATKFTFASVYLLRAVIEKSATLYLKGKDIAPKADLHLKLGQLAETLKIDGMSDRELKFLRTIASSKDDQYSADSIGHHVHGGSIPSPAYAFRYWDNIEHIMTRVLKAV